MSFLFASMRTRISLSNRVSVASREIDFQVDERHRKIRPQRAEVGATEGLCPKVEIRCVKAILLAGTEYRARKSIMKFYTPRELPAGGGGLEGL